LPRLTCKIASYLYVAQASTQILHRLLENPEYLKPLRQEIETAVAEEGWTKAAIDKMHNLDSFLRETQRMNIMSTSLSAPLHWQACH
jgi:hypothetical protein